MRRTTEELAEDLEHMRKILVKKPHTIAQLQEVFQKDRKTIYTWLGRLEDKHFAIVRVGKKRPTSYRILGS